MGSWKNAVCVLTDVMLRDAAVLPMHAENGLAHPRLRRQAMQGLSTDATEPLLAAMCTHMAHGASTPWLRQCERSHNVLAGVSAVPTDGYLRAAVWLREELRMAVIAASIPHRD
jgi:hypothetical protein